MVTDETDFGGITNWVLCYPESLKENLRKLKKLEVTFLAHYDADRSVLLNFIP